MNCKKCGRPLEADEKKLCPHCKNELNKKVKTGISIIGGILLAGLGTILGLKGKNKKT